jgi:hypothetical protein
MLAAAITIWAMFSLWLIAPHARAPARIGRIAGLMCTAELVALLTWSYGAAVCAERTCAPVAQAFGMAAKIDIPLLAAAFVVLACVQWRRQPAP